jgi:UDP-N-acetylglucosamine 2-epimerase (non-hydrolysing)
MDCDVLHIVGARPNFVKMAPVYKQLKILKVNQKILHSGQHYDKNMSEDFFNDLCIPTPNINLRIATGTHAEQTARAMIGIERYVKKLKPKIVVVYGDVNTTLAGAISAKKENIYVAHVESGLRSGDMSMPEEQNRRMVDEISDILFVTEESGMTNLLKSGLEKKSIFVGNTMIDSLKCLVDQLGHQTRENYCVATFHRPSNVDFKENLSNILDIFEKSSMKIVWPIHPRTENALRKFKMITRAKKIKNLEIKKPLAYREFVELIYKASAVITDSGGIQEETTFLKIPCITYRESTERPSTVRIGSNTLTLSPKKVLALIKSIKSNKYKECKIPRYWDGYAGNRVAANIKRKLLFL